jgi:4'-phosphopantetheinyl transferase
MAGLGEVSVWWMEPGTPSAAAVAQWRACLDEAEQVRADRFRFEEDRTTYIAAHWLLRTALSSVANVPPAQWRFLIEPRGKPRIDPAHGRPELQFNLSHTRGFVACAICAGRDIGIDVEELRPRRADLDVAKRFFGPSEVAALRGTPEDQRAEAFFRFWTLKEAFIKATGEGISRALDSFSFSLDPVAIAFDPPDADDPGKWQFFERRPAPLHLLAVAVHRPASCPVRLSMRPVS